MGIRSKQKNKLLINLQKPMLMKEDLPNRQFKITVIKMLTEVRRSVHEQSEYFNRETANIKKYEREIRDLKNVITELKSSIEGFKNRLDQMEERISELEERAVEFIQ